MNVRGVALAFKRPGVDDLAAFLGDGLQFEKISLRFEADLFLEFAFGGTKRFFAGMNFAFGNGPCACVPLFPKRASGMRQEKFQFASTRTIHQQTSADLCHAAQFSELPSDLQLLAWE